MQYVSSINPTITLPDIGRRHICEICHYILTNAEIIRILQQNYKQVLPRILLEYTMLSTTKNKLL